MRSNVLITLVNAENASAPSTLFEQCDTFRVDHCRAERSLSTVVGRLNVRIVQKSQQVATIVVPAKYVLQPVTVRIRHRSVAEMVALSVLLQPFGLHFEVLSLSSVICPPQVHGFSQKRTQTLAEAAILSLSWYEPPH